MPCQLLRVMRRLRCDYLLWLLECKGVARHWVEFFFAPGSRYSYLAASQMPRLEQETEEHYGDARVDAQQLDRMIGATDAKTWNPPGTLEIDSDDAPPSMAKEPVVFYGLPTRAGDRGRTGDVQLGKEMKGDGEDPDCSGESQ